MSQLNTENSATEPTLAQLGHQASNEITGLIDIIEPVEPSWFANWELLGLSGLVVVIMWLFFWRLWWRSMSSSRILWWRWLRQQQRSIQESSIQELNRPETSSAYQQWLWQSASELENWKQTFVSHDISMSAETLECIEAWQSLAFQNPVNQTSMTHKVSRENLSILIANLQQQARAQLLDSLTLFLYRPVKKIQGHLWKR